ncbi:MAG: YodL domain-containing protein [Oscillospiraceae bacterium]|nr:YodL domain-containing protein [Oscillospiraceae bacterium]
MHRIEVKSGLIYFYCNPAGYIESNKAVIDPIFKNDELSEWAEKENMELEWHDGMFDRLSAGIPDMETGEVKKFKDCRIWQLKPNADPLIKYIGYDELIQVQENPPDLANYRVSLDFQPNTDNIDEICNKFYEQPHPDLIGGKVNLSDIIEIYDSSGSEFNYADRRGFVEVDFKYRQEQLQDSNPAMNLQ